MSTTAPPPYAGAQPPPVAAPPKKRRKWPIVLIVIAVLMIAGIAGCAALLGGAAKSIDESITQSQEKSEPKEVVEGAAITVGSHEVLAGWKVKKDTGLGDAAFNVTGKVKNTSDATSTSFIHFKFITKSGEVIGNVDCNSSDLEPGQTQALNCILDGTYGKYAKITVEATF